MPRTIGSANSLLKYKVMLFDHQDNCTFTQSFSSFAQISKALPYWSDKTLERIVKGTSTPPFIKIIKI